MKNDKKYWESYYKKNSKPTDPSSFAEFISKHLEKDKLLVELGC